MCRVVFFDPCVDFKYFLCPLCFSHAWVWCLVGACVMVLNLFLVV